MGEGRIGPYERGRSVMRLEQRGRVKQPSAHANRQREERVDAAKTVTGCLMGAV